MGRSLLTPQPEMLFFFDPVLSIVLCGQVPVTAGRESHGQSSVEAGNSAAELLLPFVFSFQALKPEGCAQLTAAT